MLAADLSGRSSPHDPVCRIPRPPGVGTSLSAGLHSSREPSISSSDSASSTLGSTGNTRVWRHWLPRIYTLYHTWELLYTDVRQIPGELRSPSHVITIYNPDEGKQQARLLLGLKLLPLIPQAAALGGGGVSTLAASFFFFLENMTPIHKPMIGGMKVHLGSDWWGSLCPQPPSRVKT